MAKIEDELHYVLDLLERYKNEALIEYSILERQRHKVLSHRLPDGKNVEGGHPEAIKHWLTVYRDVIFSHDETKVDSLYEDILKRSNIKKTEITPLSKEYKQQFKFRLVKAEADILQKDLRRAEERFNPDSQPFQDSLRVLQQPAYYPPQQPQQPLMPKQEQQPQTIQSNNGKKLSEAIDEYIKQHINNKKWAEKDTIDRNKSYLAKVLICIEEDKPLNDYVATDFDRMLGNFKKLPTNISRNPIFRELKTFKQIMNAAKKQEYEPLTAKTINMHLQKLYDFLDWAQSRQYISTIPFRLKDFTLAVDETEDSVRRSFDIEDFRVILEGVGQLAECIYNQSCKPKDEEYKIETVRFSVSTT